MIESNMNFDSINWPTEEPYWVVLDEKGRECSEYYTHYYQAMHAMKYGGVKRVVNRKIIYN